MILFWKNNRIAVQITILTLTLFIACSSPTSEDNSTKKNTFEGSWKERGTNSFSEFTSKAITFKADSFYCQEIRFSTEKLMTFTANGLVPAACDPKNGTYYSAGIWDTINGSLVFTGKFTDSMWVYSSTRSCPSNLAFKRIYKYTVNDTLLTFTSELIDDSSVETLSNPITL